MIGDSSKTYFTTRTELLPRFNKTASSVPTLETTLRQYPSHPPSASFAPHRTSLSMIRAAPHLPSPAPVSARPLTLARSGGP